MSKRRKEQKNKTRRGKKKIEWKQKLKGDDEALAAKRQR